MAMMLTRAVMIFLVTIITKAESWMLKAGREKDGKAELVEGLQSLSVPQGGSCGR
jgi:hypothetical protein